MPESDRPQSPDSEVQRRFQRTVDRCEEDGLWFFPGLFAIQFGLMLIGKTSGWVKGIPVLSIVVGAGMLFRAIRAGYPACPACHRSVVGKFGPHCPECGARSVRSCGLFRSPQCESCHRRFRGRHKGRNYRIHHCSHCGVRISERGY